MSAKHTPGKWKQHGSIVWAPGARSVICQVSEVRHYGSDTVMHVSPRLGSLNLVEIYANAALIAEAPDLLASLRVMVDFHAGEEGGIDPQLAEARALIARIDGAA